MLADIVLEAAAPSDAGPLLVVQRSAYVSEAQWYGETRIPLFTGADSPHNIRLYERHGYTASHTEQLNERVTFVHMTKLRPAG